MENDVKVFYRSKRFWSNIVLIVGAIGFLFTGEKTWDAILPELVVAIVAITNIVLASLPSETKVLGWGGGK